LGLAQLAIPELTNNVILISQTTSIEAPAMIILQNIWRELIWPFRHVWAGLAVAWILIFAINFSIHDHSNSALTRSSPSPQTLPQYQQQEQLLEDMMAPNETPVAGPQKTDAPQPSSRRFSKILIA
jgi:hypothetical protein